LAKLGCDVKLIGAIGHDLRGQFIGELDKHRIEYEVLESKETGGFSRIYYDAHGNRTLDLLGRADPIGEMSPAWFAGSDAVLIGPILGEVSFEQIRQVRESFDGLYFCDPQGLLRGADEKGRIFHEKPEGIEEALGRFDIVKPNELEGLVLTGINCRDNPYEAAKIIHSWGPKLVIVTLAELGSVIYDGERFVDIPPFQVNLLDSTGAGDTYMAGFTYEYLHSGGDLKRSGCFASCVSSIMIEQIGPDFELTEQEVRRRQAQLLNMDKFKVDVAVNK
jgi:sugar/nucleoside kinase (ribokinase family)